MNQKQTVAAALEIIDGTLDDLAAAGCTPLDCAAALFSAGFVELRDSDEPLDEQLAVCRMFLVHSMDLLRRIESGHTELH